MINYDYYQAEGICSIGSGAVESAIKQIDRRVQISGARWKMSRKFWHTALPTSMDYSLLKDDMLPTTLLPKTTMGAVISFRPGSRPPILSLEHSLSLVASHCPLQSIL